MVRTIKRSALAVLALSLFGFAAQTAMAVEGAGAPRGSALIFPYYNVTAGYRTFMRVTHAVPTDVPRLDVALHNMYLETVRNVFTQQDECREFNRFHPLTTNDAEIWDVRSEAPNNTRGFAISYLVERFSPVSFGAQVMYDTLFGDTVILNTAEGWIVGVPAINVQADPQSIPIQPFPLALDQQVLIAQAEGVTFGGPDADAINYHYITFGNDFFVNFFNARAQVDPTEVVILPFTILLDVFSGVNLWAQPREAFDGGTNQWSWFGDWFDADERTSNVPNGSVNCWGIRTVDEITAGGASTANRGYGWIRMVTLPGRNTYFPSFGPGDDDDQMAVLFQLEDPSVGNDFGWGFYTPHRAGNLFLLDDGPFPVPGFFPWPDNDGKTTVERIAF